ncbi:unnamed protein product [Parascedosporium putredinis]|uniref:Uncharacterized protein n=1 Tax=Parascedosporium putredinis TaxID=1442378 RepID=A0A9P1GXB5_9PEZI|nr:unnamed protein product [Parascedosporium putredinis]CAI7989649.1 unnamed protein product [Parascedosporium putredinis]
MASGYTLANSYPPQNDGMAAVNQGAPSPTTTPAGPYNPEPNAYMGGGGMPMKPQEPPPSARRKNIFARFGSYLMLLQLVSIVLLVVAVGLLSWIWLCSRENEAWRKLFLGPYAIRIITTVAVFIRFALSSLSSVVTAMLAAVAIERAGVPLDKIAVLSIARFTNSGPQALLKSAAGGRTFTLPATVLIALLAACTIASQFTSTILLSDVRIDGVMGFLTPTPMNYTFSGLSLQDPVRANSIPYRMIMPNTFETFAEYAEPENRLVSDTVDDTGPLWRAFLPISDPDVRQSIGEYEGLGYVNDFRTTCVRPKITDIKECKPIMTDSTIEFCGNGTIDDVLPLPFPGPKNFQFRCSILADEMGSTLSYGVCSPTGAQPRYSSLDPRYYHEATGEDALKYAPGYVFIGMRDTLSKATESEFYSESTTPPTDSGVWIPFKVTEDGTGGTGGKTTRPASSLRDFIGVMTFCTHPVYTQKPLVRHLNISASGPPQNRKMEPGALQWDSGAAMYRHEDVQRQLGATKDSVSLDDRGILAMDKDSFYDNLEKVKKMSLNNTEGFGNDTTTYMESALRVPLSISVLYCSGCPQTDDVLLSSIFLHGLAVNTILMRQIYHSFANAFTQPSVSELALIQAASAPVSRTGYIIVMGLIAAQLVIYLLVWLMFSRTKYSVLHNSWLTIAQVSETPEAAPLLARAGR